MPKRRPDAYMLPIFVFLVASVTAVAVFSLPWITTTGQFRHSQMKLPDLKVSELTWSQLSDGSVQLTATITNVGNAAAGGFNVRFWDVTDDMSAGMTTVPGIGIGGTATATVRHNSAQGCVIRATADWGNLVLESDETNNNAEITVG